jgi:hypothetical protein|eukprot:COSAG06_NODE_1257_length_10084_cov_3.046770_5_plen_94_part_00
MRLPSEPSLIFMALADSRSPSIAIQGAEGWLRVTSPQAWTSTPSRCGCGRSVGITPLDSSASLRLQAPRRCGAHPHDGVTPLGFSLATRASLL